MRFRQLCAWVQITFQGQCAPDDETHVRILAALYARVLHRMSLSKCRGRRECRVKASPMARLQEKKQAAVTTGSAKSSGIPCAMVLRLIACSPR
jgi:hypothetical protein